MAGSCNSIYIYFLVNKGTISLHFEESLVLQTSPAFLHPPFCPSMSCWKREAHFICAQNSPITCHQKFIPILLCSPIQKLIMLERVKMHIFDGCIYYFTLTWHIFLSSSSSNKCLSFKGRRDMTLPFFLKAQSCFYKWLKSRYILNKKFYFCPAYQEPLGNTYYKYFVLIHFTQNGKWWQAGGIFLYHLKLFHL